MKSNKFWLIVLGSVVTVSAVAAVLLWQVQASYASIYKDGELFRPPVNLLAVTEPYTVVIFDGFSSNSDNPGTQGGAPGFNVIEVEAGRVRMAESNCSFGICMQRGWVSGGIMPVVCLPNRVVVVFEGGFDDYGVDAVVG